MLINAIVSRCPLSLKSEVLQRLERLEVKKALADRVRDSTRDVPPSLAHELYVLQTHLLSEKADRAKYGMYSVATRLQHFQGTTLYGMCLCKQQVFRIDVPSIENTHRILILGLVSHDPLTGYDGNLCRS